MIAKRTKHRDGGDRECSRTKKIAYLRRLYGIPDNANAIVFLDDTYVKIPEAHIFGEYKITKEEED